MKVILILDYWTIKIYQNLWCKQILYHKIYKIPLHIPVLKVSFQNLAIIKFNKNHQNLAKD